MARGKEVNKQSLILVHFLSHMARVGTETYAENLLMDT
jgi:hypothetical protein